MLQDCSRVIHAGRRFLAFFCLCDHIAHDRAKAFRGVELDLEWFACEEFVNALDPERLDRVQIDFPMAFEALERRRTAACCAGFRARFVPPSEASTRSMPCRLRTAWTAPFPKPRTWPPPSVISFSSSRGSPMLRACWVTTKATESGPFPRKLFSAVNAASSFLERGGGHLHAASFSCVSAGRKQRLKNIRRQENARRERRRRRRPDDKPRYSFAAACTVRQTHQPCRFARRQQSRTHALALDNNDRLPT